MNIPLVAARTLHLAATLTLFGTLLFHALLAVPAYSRHGQALTRLRPQLWRIGWISAAIALAAALPLILFVAQSMSGADFGALFTGNIIGTVLTDTQFGRVWLLRFALLALMLPGLAWLGRNRALDLLTLVPALGFLAALAWQGHGGAEIGTAGLIQSTADAGHIAAAAAWIGALPPLALLLRDAGERLEAFTVAYDATAAFSTLGIVCVLMLLVTGGTNAWFLVGSLPALIGTPYGQLLLVKLLFFAALVAIAAANRFHLLPRLASTSATLDKRAAINRLRRNALIEAFLGIGVIAVVGVLGTLVPAAHQSPWWPFPVRPGLDALSDPALRKEAIATALLAVLGLGLLALGWRRRHPMMIAVGLVLAAGLGWRPIQLLLIDATPTSYDSSTVPFTIGSITRGAQIYARHCVLCHGGDGRGDGPQAATLPIAPADLTAPHLFFHTDGDLYWFVSDGLDGGIMPGFARNLDDGQRWDVINFIKARAAGAQANTMSATVTASAAPRAPDFPLTDAGASRLSEVLQKGSALLVLTAADSPLATGFDAERGVLAEAGTTLIVNDDPAVRRTYGLYDEPPATSDGPVVFLIDRNGYIRARWHPGEAPDWRDIALLDNEITALDRLPLAPPVLAGHVHQSH